MICERCQENEVMIDRDICGICFDVLEALSWRIVQAFRY